MLIRSRLFVLTTLILALACAAPDSTDLSPDDVAATAPSEASDGAWLARNGEERNVGTVYATSLSILSLSVRYHYLPIYQR